MAARNIKLVIRYDGSDFSGWQVQPNARTVQGVLTEAVAKVVDHPVTLTGASRTDAGVHALGQVANFRTDSSVPLNNLWRGINSLVRPDIRVDQIEEVHAEFDSRHDAKRKTYRYTVAIDKFGDPLVRRMTWSIGRPLDIDGMRKAAQVFVGTHDFTSFQAAGSNEHVSPVRTIERIDIVESPPNPATGRSRTITIEVTGRGFLYKMVRNIVGTLAACGQGILSEEQVRSILDRRDRSLASPTAPPEGLTLVNIEY
ncbi:MAG: tRNA pseudouridine(38-40) synthase TruA [Candidatus Hydrogenedentes bacterium]|nr:tRNA pseudouridine(38-40) synthase TruA [Candidatus Hydrogenedentota bacterium]